jgi:hypothetical protein
MAGTSGLKWKLLPAVLLASLNLYGDSFSTTYYDGDDRWQCPLQACLRVEIFEGDHWPYCSGTPDNVHLRTQTRKVLADEELEPAADGPYFS